MFASLRQFAIPALYVSGIGAFLLLGVGGMLLLQRPMEAIQSLLGGLALFGLLTGLASLLEYQASMALSLAALASVAARPVNASQGAASR